MTAAENYLILFADLVSSTEVAAEVTPSDYARNYIASYHWAARRAEEFISSKTIFKKDRFLLTIDEVRIAGDEVLSFSPLSFQKHGRVKLEDMVASAVAFAYVTKLYWLASPYNLRRMLDKQFPRDIAVGIHIGPAALVPKKKEEARQLASLHINVAKRIETLAREGSESRIFASYDVADMYKGWLARHQEIPIKFRSPLTFTEFLRRPDASSIKGMTKKIQLLELAWSKGSLDGLMNLLRQLTISPEEEDIDAEKAAQFLAENFLIKDQDLFMYGKNTRAIHYGIPGASTAPGYIRQWFRAVEGPSKLFLDECWLVLNCYLVSCAMLRHKALPPSDRKRYVKITQVIFARLRDLVQ